MFADKFIKKLVLARDPDFTKVTDAEAKVIDAAEKSGFVDSEDINRDNPGV